jgi:hypothetical protein
MSLQRSVCPAVSVLAPERTLGAVGMWRTDKNVHFLCCLRLCVCLEGASHGEPDALRGRGSWPHTPHI